jgi:hypothetical protein
MKKFWVVLLSLGLIVAFGATASAADVKFGGSYYVVGVYESNPNLTPDDVRDGRTHYSRAFFYQRVRLQPVFQIAEGLTFTARMDALEKQWGNTNWKSIAAPGDDTTSSRRVSAGNQKIQESLEFERAYVTFMTRIGMFQIGYQNVDDWGTDYSDFSNSRPRFAYVTKAGPVEIAFTYEKVFENDTFTNAPTRETDRDNDTYALSGTYKGKGMEAGLLYKYYVYNANRPAGIKTTMNQISPYAKATFGPLFIEGELQYWFGKAAAYEAPITPLPQDQDLKAWGAFLRGRFNMGPAYVGGAFAYSSGDDLTDPTKNTLKPGGAGPNWAPALILMNDALNTWTNGTGLVSTANMAQVGTDKKNTLIYNLFGGFNPTPKLNVEMALTYATVDKKALTRNAVTGVVTEADSNKLGTELDVKATYKIYDNLSYMVGAGYLWAGDYFKGNTPVGAVPRVIENDYILLNQLTLAF